MKETAASKVLASTDVPIFLRKTYHLIDSCDPDVASWSPDGEMFIVKQPDRFETEFIPQFFKHSKFSSFVRQLNFYSFRKIKYSDSIKIDQETNHWRFKHEFFVKGKPELLKNIRRVQASQNNSIPDKSDKVCEVAQDLKKPEEVDKLRCEVDVLKDRLAKMSANIDQLTSMVNKIAITDDSIDVGSKRKLVKVEEVCSMGDFKADDATFTGPMLVATDEDAVPETIFPSLSVTPTKISFCENSEHCSLLPEDDFVDDLFATFSDESYSLDDFPEPVASMIVPRPHLQSEHSDIGLSESEGKVSLSHPNAPDPALITRLSEALTLLPRDFQELLVNRLIATITSSDSLMNHLDSAYKNSPEGCKSQEKKSNSCVPIPFIPIHA